MARRERLVGSGMTAHRRVVLKAPFARSEVADFVKSMKAAGEAAAPWAWLEREIGIAERTLSAIADGQLAKRDHTLFEPHAGPGWFSREILARASAIKVAQERGDAETAAKLGYQLGQLANTIRLKNAWDADVLAALQTQEQRRDGGRATRRPGSDAERLSRWAHYYAQTGKAGAADALAGEEFGVKAGTIRNLRTKSNNGGKR